MKHFTITITGQCPDDVPNDWIHQAAMAAEVQVIEPQVDNADDSFNPTSFETTEVETKVAILGG